MPAVTKRDVTIEERLERSTPRALSARSWANARDSAVSAVLATSPSDETRTVCLLSRLCTFLAAHRSWAGDVTPDLAALLTPASIDAFVAECLRRGEHRGTVGVYRTSQGGGDVTDPLCAPDDPDHGFEELTAAESVAVGDRLLLHPAAA